MAMTSADILQFRPTRARHDFRVDPGALLAAALFIAVVLIEALIIATAAPAPIDISLYATVT
jgi:preprotein translocase subunit Sec61beta